MKQPTILDEVFHDDSYLTTLIRRVGLSDLESAYLVTDNIPYIRMNLVIDCLLKEPSR